MEDQNEAINKVRRWFQKHTQDALTQYQPKFWIIFWVTAALSFGLYYSTYDAISPYLNQKGRFLLLMGYLCLPLLSLRNLHPLAFVYLGGGILSVVL